MNRAERLAAASRTLGELITHDPIAAALINDDLPDRGRLTAAIRGAVNAHGMPGLRTEKRRRLAQIAAHDVSGEISLAEVGKVLSDLADACLEISLEALNASDRLAVVAMGKLGGNELNYASDIDIMFVGDGDLSVAIASAESLLRGLGEFTPEGQAYRIDLELRPEGRSGALVRTLDGYREYYERWADSWEFQALIKARPAAGDAELGAGLVEIATPLVYPERVPPERVAAIREMKERVELHAARSARRGRASGVDDVKLGPGGIRDIEFSVQLLQLVHGGADHSVRQRPTLDAIAALVEGGYLAEDDGAGLQLAYEWLRTVEHRLQLWNERQTHRLPANSDDRGRLARVMGFKDSPAAGADAQFDERHRAILADVRSRFEKLFYRPMIESLADGPGLHLSHEALKERLRVLGYRDVDRAARTLAGLVAGTSRRARTFKVLTPVLLRWLASTPMPDEGLFSFLRLREALGDRVDVLSALRDNPPALALLARVLGSGRILGEVLGHVPEEIAAIAHEGDRTKPLTRARLSREAAASLEWRPPEERLDGLRRFKRRVFFEIAVDDIAERIDVSGVGRSLADLADACLEAALGDCAIPFAVIGMGKLGGLELSYSSDIDVMFVHMGDPLAAERVAENLMSAIGEVTPEGRAFQIDAQIRPEGKSGPLTRSIESFVEYYERWGRPWECLALLKARWSAGDRDVGNALIDATRRWAWPEKLAPEAVAEIRHLKARMERERIPRGSDPRRNFKLGPGGLSDIEFAVQLIQMRHAYENEPLRVPSTLDAIEGARKAGLVVEEAAAQLSSAYAFLCALRNRLFLIAGRPLDALPGQPERMEALGIALGYKESPRQQLEEDYLRITRRTRRVAEPLVYGP
jgi:[glutamine synthetase] adenylyltransferase / [glutamine synthetase]-adenylyl-L-tyrosine phosphorylase